MSRRYLNNRDLLREIHLSKATYGFYADPAFIDYDTIVTDLAAVQQEGIRYRVITGAHVPQTDAKGKRSRSPLLAGRVRCNFTPFSHYLFSNGQPIEVGRSHWAGDLITGHFSLNHGRVTDRLGRMWVRLVSEYAKKPNWRAYSYIDEMQAQALTQLSAEGLKFDEHKGDNPFAFYTQTVKNVFIKVLGAEHRVQDIRDEIRKAAGLKPSWAALD